MKDKFYYINEIANAILRRENIYFISLKEGNGLVHYDIPLPTPQACGTMTQQRSYARDKATSILNALTS